MLLKMFIPWALLALIPGAASQTTLLPSTTENPLPVTCNEPILSNIFLEFYSRENLSQPIFLTEDNINVVLNANRESKFIFHGWMEASEWMLHMKDAYLQKADYNVIKVDWSFYAMALYDDAACYLPKVAILVSGLLSKSQLDWGSVHFIGMSLGAHLSGFIGQNLQNDASVGRKVARITGLDAAGPLFTDVMVDERLSLHDAEFVDAIHTNGGLYGIAFPYGHVDFYPNGGSIQPGCDISPITGCDHKRAYDLMIESILADGFVANSCFSYEDYSSGFCDNNPIAIMGENCAGNIIGDYYLNTNALPPYAQG